MIYKESYQRLQLTITEFDKEDVITTSTQIVQPTENGGSGLPILGPGLFSTPGPLGTPGQPPMSE